MNEIDLIKEIEKHPILYDKSISGFNKTKLREDAWTAVRDSLNVSGTNFLIFVLKINKPNYRPNIETKQHFAL